MAYYAALASLLELLHDLLHRNQFQNFLLGTHQPIKSLHKKFSLLLDSLQDYSSKGNEAAAHLETRIRDAACLAQDIIEFEIPDEQIHSISEWEINHVCKKTFQLLILACQNSLRPQSNWVEFKEHLQQVEQKVDSIVDEVNAIKESQRSEYLRQDYDAAADTTTSASEQAPIDSNATVGFEGNYSNPIKHQLCGDPSSKLQVIPIIGMGGIGKTTFAGTIFEDRLIKDRFDYRGWVAVSQDYDVIRLLQNILKSLEKNRLEKKETLEEKNEREKKELEEFERKKKELEEIERKKKEELEKRKMETPEERIEREKKDQEERDRKKRLKEEREREKKKLLEKKKKELEEETPDQRFAREKKESEERRRKQKIALEERIHKYLTGRRYLIVIDDVWDTIVCNDIKRILPDNCNGSRIMLTTRSMKVAESVGTSEFIHQMQILSEEDSWELLRKKVFESEDPRPQALEVIGNSIAKKCKGLPLAIVVVAGILSKDKTHQHWETVEKDVVSALSRDDDYLSNILSLSYNHLPHHLKACFLYMGSFPEDYEISISKLIKLWIAEGFLICVSKLECLEKVGEECIVELVKRSLVIISRKGASGEIKSCIMHDVLRDFCRKKGVHESFFKIIDQEGHLDPSEAKDVRRIILDSVTAIAQGYDGKYVRSICSFSRKAFADDPDFELAGNQQLRILDVADIETVLAPVAVSQMFLLKYLALRLRSRQKKTIPPSISKFQNLQTLIIYAPIRAPISLPSEIWKMPQLRHIIIARMILPPIAPDGYLCLQKLESLQTLETVVDFIFTDEATWAISNIKKLKLSCRGQEARAIWKLYSLENLASLLQLEKLNIIFDAIQFSYVQSFRSSFSFPKNLRKLSLESCGLPWEELTVVGSLKFLEVLRLKRNALVGEKWEPVEHEFPKLKFLLMESLDLMQWTAEKECFQCLEHLKINNCSELEVIPSEIGEIDALKFITVHNSKRAGVSAKKILEKQRDNGDEELQVIVRYDGIDHVEEELTEPEEHSEDEGMTSE